MVAGDSTYYEALLDVLYDGAEALPTIGYRGTDSDRWNRARSMVQAAGRGHLMLLIWLRGVIGLNPMYRDREARAVFMHRYSPSDDRLSQAQLQAAMDHLVDYLEGFGLPDGTRVLQVLSTDVVPFDEQWTDVSIEFILRTPRSL